jgi:hypothetical protein
MGCDMDLVLTFLDSGNENEALWGVIWIFLDSKNENKA